MPTPSDLFLDNLALIEDVIRLVAHRCRIPAQDQEEFRSGALLKLMDRDYAAIRGFRGQCSFKGYLFVVLRRHLLDCRAKDWGRWRPSTNARRAGPAAILLERLIERDGFSANEAVRAVADQPRWQLASADVWRLHAVLPPRRQRHVVVAMTHAEVVPASAETDAWIEAQDAQTQLARTHDALRQVVGQCSREERQLLRLRFRDGLTIHAIAEELGVAPKKLYRQMDAILRRIRRALQRHAITGDVVRRVVGRPCLEFGTVLVDSALELGRSSPHPPVSQPIA